MLCGFDGVGMRRRGEPETRINWDFKRGEIFLNTGSPYPKTYCLQVVYLGSYIGRLVEEDLGDKRFLLKNLNE